MNSDDSRRRARKSDPETSHVAARRAARFAGSHKGRILSALAGEIRLSVREIAEATGLTVVQIDRRMVELQRDGRVGLIMVEGRPLVVDGCRVWCLREKILPAKSTDGCQRNTEGHTCEPGATPQGSPALRCARCRRRIKKAASIVFGSPLGPVCSKAPGTGVDPRQMGLPFPAGVRT